MASNKGKDEAIDWTLTTWEGARREQLRRWAALPLENIVRALEEMEQTTAGTRESESRGGKP